MRIEVIPHGLDLTRFKPLGKHMARELLSLPQDKKLILSGAIINDKNKGFQFLKPALRELAESGWVDRAELIVFGSSKPVNPPDFRLKTLYVGYLHDDVSLRLLYAAADVMIVPSIQEAFGQTASEAMACGTPVVAFGATGLKDIVEHQHNGYLAKPFRTDDLACGIAWVLENKDRHQVLSHHARQKAECEFNQELQARRYLALYEELLAQR